MISKENIPESYKKLNFYRWDRYYYKNIPCVEVDEVVIGDIIEDISDYPYGVYKVYSTGYIEGYTLSGNLKLKINNE